MVGSSVALTPGEQTMGYIRDPGTGPGSAWGDIISNIGNQAVRIIQSARTPSTNVRLPPSQTPTPEQTSATMGLTQNALFIIGALAVLVILYLAFK